VNFWKTSFSLRRCIVPADSFFEWQKTEKGQKPKFEFTILGSKPFGMAVLWAPWKNPKTNQWEETFAIVTVEANETMTPVHDRQRATLRHAITRNIRRMHNGPSIYFGSSRTMK
jgi:putative SOS response-associated peptidase YedK